MIYLQTLRGNWDSNREERRRENYLDVVFIIGMHDFFSFTRPFFMAKGCERFLLHFRLFTLSVIH